MAIHLSPPFFIVIFFCFLPPGTLNGRIFMHQVCARSQLPCRDLHRLSQLLHMACTSRSPHISTGQMGNGGSGSWGPDQLKGTMLTTMPPNACASTLLCAPRVDKCFCTRWSPDRYHPVQLMVQQEGVSY